MTSTIKVDTISENTSANGVTIDGLTIKDGGITATTGSIVFNEASADVDFRVESNDVASMLFVNGGTNKVGVGLDDPTGTFHVKSTDAGTTMFIEDTHAGGGDGPELYLYRNSASPAANDDTGIINFLGKNDAGQDVNYVQIKSIIKDATDGQEDGKLELFHALNGALTPSFQITPTEIVLNESSNDLDFRVESNGVDKMLFVNGGTNSVSIGGEATPLGRLHVITADSGSSAHANADEFVIEGSAYSGMTIASGTTSHGTIAFADSGDELAGRIIYNHSTNALSFGAAGVGTQWSINSDGNLLPGNSTGQGIHLGVTSAGAANLLDDYEEGTWTPVLKSATNTVSYSGTFLANYVKIGRMVHYSLSYRGGTFSGDVTGATTSIEGLPFTSSSTAGNRQPSTQVNYYVGIKFDDENVLGLVGENTSVLEIVGHDGATSGYGSVGIHSVGSNAYMQVSGIYYV